MLGVLLIDKPAGLTSHDVVNLARRVLGTKRVGHAGSLDPVATGLLVLAVGPATRFLQYLPLEPKVYVAEIAFGRSSTTYDSEGELSEAKALPTDLVSAIEAELPKFRGLIDQVPPMFSAIKVHGQPLYKYARMGKELPREPRRVHIATFALEDSSDLPEGTVRALIHCSGGTYIRSLAHDLGQALGVGAHLTGLRRTGVGKFTVDMASSSAAISPGNLIPLREALPPMPLTQIDPAQEAAIRDGKAIEVTDLLEGRLTGLMDSCGNVFSVARIEGNVLHPECVIPAEALHGTL